MKILKAAFFFCLILSLMGCPKRIYYDWNEYIFIKNFECENKKYGMVSLINPKVTKLPLSENDTITIDGKFYKNVYLCENNSIIEYKSGAKVIMGNDNDFGKLLNCGNLNYLPYIKRVSGIAEIK